MSNRSQPLDCSRMYRAVIDGEDHYVRYNKRYEKDRRPQSVKFLKIDIEGVDYACLKAILQDNLF